MCQTLCSGKSLTSILNIIKDQLLDLIGYLPCLVITADNIILRLIFLMQYLHNIQDSNGTAWHKSGESKCNDDQVLPQHPLEGPEVLPSEDGFNDAWDDEA